MKTSRQMFVWLTALAVMIGVSSAYGASLIRAGDLCENPDGAYGDGYTAPASQVMALTADGTQAAGDSVTCADGRSGCRVAVRDWAPYGGPPNMLEMGWKGAGWAAGIGIATGGNVVMSGNAGSWLYASGNIGRYSLNGTTFSVLYDHNGKGSNVLVGANSVSADGKYICGEYTKGTQGQVWTTNDGTSVGNAKKKAGVYKETKWQSASCVNSMVGQDMHGNRNSKDGAIYCLNIMSGSPQGIPALAGEFTDRGQGRGISDNGQYCTGYLYGPNHGVTYAGFRWSPGDASSTMLADYGSDYLCWGGDVADDGTVVGWSYGYDPAGQSSYDAAFWPDPSTCVLLKNHLDSIGVDTSEWASLTKVYAVSADGLFMGGYGVWAADSTTRGFIADLREPIELVLDIQPDSIVVTNTNMARLPIHLYGTEDVPGEAIALDSIMIEGVVEPVKVKVVDLDLDGINDVKIHISRQDLKDAMSLQNEAQGSVVTVTMTAARADGWPLVASDTLVCDRAD